MRLNRWTVGLAAVGLVSLPAGVLADEATKMEQVWSKVASTTIGGYVDTSAQWNFGTGNENTAPYAYSQGKADGFNLNVVKLSVSHPLDEAQWAAGYQVDMLYGPDARMLGTSVDSGFNADSFALQQAYVSLRTPVGNGLDFKVGVFNTIVGYESFDAGKNPNFTRSYGFTMEPTTHEGALMSYQFTDWLGMQLGIANTFGPIIGDRAEYYGRAESYKSYMGSLAITAPKDWGFLEGSTFYAGFINGFNANNGATGANATDTHFYAGATLNTPAQNVKVGAAFDYAFLGQLPAVGGLDNSSTTASGTVAGPVSVGSGYQWNIAGYLSIKATEKLSLHGRVEYYSRTGADYIAGQLPSKATEVTATIQYDLWKNVISRLEFRWDHSADGMHQFGADDDFANPSRINQCILAANFIYQF